MPRPMFVSKHGTIVRVERKRRLAYIKLFGSQRHYEAQFGKFRSIDSSRSKPWFGKSKLEEEFCELVVGRIVVVYLGTDKNGEYVADFALKKEWRETRNRIKQKKKHVGRHGGFINSQPVLGRRHA